MKRAISKDAKALVSLLDPLSRASDDVLEEVRLITPDEVGCPYFHIFRWAPVAFYETEGPKGLARAEGSSSFSECILITTRRHLFRRKSTCKIPEKASKKVCLSDSSVHTETNDPTGIVHANESKWVFLFGVTAHTNHRH